MPVNNLVSIINSTVFVVLAAILKQLVFEVTKLSREVREMLQRMDCLSIPAAIVQDVVPVSELMVHWMTCLMSYSPVCVRSQPRLMWSASLYHFHI